MADYGYSLTHTPRGYWQFAGDRLVIEPAAEQAVLKGLATDQPQPVLTYLANTIRVGGQEIPYSTVSAIDFAAAPPLGPFKNPAGEPLPPLADGEIALNTWAVDDLGAKVGDDVELVYFEPESTHGQVREDTVKLRLAAIVELEGAAADRNLTPEMKGVTDQASISNWDPPFPFEAARVRKKDEKYWDEYRATPRRSSRSPPASGSGRAASAARRRSGWSRRRKQRLPRWPSSCNSSPPISAFAFCRSAGRRLRQPRARPRSACCFWRSVFF